MNYTDDKERRGKSWHSERVGGTIHDLNGCCLHRYCYQGVRHKWSPGIKFHPDNKAESIERHERWVDQIMHPEKYSPTKRPMRDSPRQVTLYSLIYDFEETRVKELKPTNQQNFERAFAFFVRKPIKMVEDKQANFNANFDHLQQRKKDEALDHNVKSTYLQTLSRFLREYMIPLGWVDRNPVEVLGKMKRKRKPRSASFTAVTR